MTPDQKKRVQAIEERANAAKKGPWSFTFRKTWKGMWEVALKSKEPLTIYPHIGASVFRHISQFRIKDKDAAFISHSREDIPWLIARYRETDAQLHGKTTQKGGNTCG